MLVSTNEINYGTIQVGSSNEATVTITAEEFPLSINSVIVGCGSCTTAAVDKKVVSANEATTLTITFRPTGKGAGQRKKVTLNISENNTNVVVQIFLNATVI